MTRKTRLMALTLALAAIAPAALAGCGGAAATPTLSTGMRPEATSIITGTVPTQIPTMEGGLPQPVGTGVPSAVQTAQPTP